MTRQGTDVYKPWPAYRLTMQHLNGSKVTAVSSKRDKLTALERDLTACEYQFVQMERIDNDGG